MRNNIVAENLTKSYGKNIAVKQVNLSLESGEIVGLLGPNGAGKTTTFYMIIGLIRPDTGKILFNGTDIGNMPVYRRARMGINYLPQEPSIFRKLSVKDNIRSVLEMRATEKSDIDTRTEELIHEFNLDEFANRDGYSLSGGERRRTEIARALSTDPVFLLFDEPFAGIDPIAINDLKKMLQYLKEKGLGILITDHNVRDTLSITDRAYIISNGEVLYEGVPEELIKNSDVRKSYLGEEFRL
ncbi:lipopolysaccharide export system ATP-binding protein LptB [bacterium BMS3Abin07]|nr:lipopolysaccharide export system ATP-binding protein LptB [bacterium BMS3Abin07]GBE32073.1 lipopolysaccharide export system ATP-binding protein LptB [bacterium BMS3Bbin05]HDO22663.1 LPS export ABC transporter ATP-binding protein [Nitrospirota bacterium]